MTWRDVIEVGQRQRGVVSVRQAMALGVARSTIDDRVAASQLLRPRRGVLLLPGADETDPRTRAWTALCGVGSPAWVGGAYALALADVVRVPPVVDVVVPRRRRPRARDGVRIVRHEVTPDHVRETRGVPVVVPELALRQVAAVDSHRETLAATASAVQRGITTLARIDGLTPPRGNGVVTLRTVVAQLRDSGAHSVLAHETTLTLRQAGWEVDAEVPVRRPDGRLAVVDAMIRGTGVAIECDGDGAHGTRSALSRDRQRRNELTLTDLIVLHVDWHRLARDRAGFLREVRLAVAKDAEHGR